MYADADSPIRFNFLGASQPPQNIFWLCMNIFFENVEVLSGWFMKDIHSYWYNAQAFMIIDDDLTHFWCLCLCMKCQFCQNFKLSLINNGASNWFVIDGNLNKKYFYVYL